MENNNKKVQPDELTKFQLGVMDTLKDWYGGTFGMPAATGKTIILDSLGEVNHEDTDNRLVMVDELPGSAHLLSDFYESFSPITPYEREQLMFGRHQHNAIDDMHEVVRGQTLALHDMQQQFLVDDMSHIERGLEREYEKMGFHLEEDRVKAVSLHSAGGGNRAQRRAEAKRQRRTGR